MCLIKIPFEFLVCYYLRGHVIFMFCRLDDHTLEITTIFALLDARSFAMPMLR